MPEICKNGKSSVRTCAITNTFIRTATHELFG